MWRSGSEIMRCTSAKPPWAWIVSEMSATILGPNVITGTKWPSMTSMWITRAPAAITSPTCSRMRPKSADRMDGATSTELGQDGMRAMLVTAGEIEAVGAVPVRERLAAAGQDLLTLATADRADRVDQHPARCEQAERMLEEAPLELGQLARLLLGAAPAGIRSARERAQPGAGRVEQHAVESAPGILQGVG